MDNNKEQGRLVRTVKELLRYSVAGGISFVCDFGLKTLIYYLFPAIGGAIFFGFELDLSVIVSTTAGFILGLIVNYIISILYVFTTEKQKKLGRGLKPFFTFLWVSVVGLIINYAVTQIGCNMFDITNEKMVPFMIVSVVAAGVGHIWNYLGRKAFVYKGE